MARQSSTTGAIEREVNSRSSVITVVFQIKANIDRFYFISVNTYLLQESVTSAA